MATEVSLLKVQGTDSPLRRLVPIVMVFFLGGLLLGFQAKSKEMPPLPQLANGDVLVSLPAKWASQLKPGLAYILKLDESIGQECLFPRTPFRIQELLGQGFANIHEPLKHEQIELVALLRSMKNPPKLIDANAPSVGTAYHPCPMRRLATYGD